MSTSINPVKKKREVIKYIFRYILNCAEWNGGSGHITCIQHCLYVSPSVVYYLELL